MLVVKGKNFYLQKIFANSLSITEIEREGEIQERKKSKHYFQKGNNEWRGVFHFNFNFEYAMDINFGNVHVKEAKYQYDKQIEQDQEEEVEEKGSGSSP